MEQLYQLIKDGEKWSFGNEATLENFIWDNLKEIFEFIPLKRQYYIDGNICDILAVSQNRQLVIIELKNAEDRYVIQQVTRYYHALSKEKPFSEQIDYKKPVQLIVIAPTFHQDNLIDCIYHKLTFDLLRFAIVGENNFKFQAKSINGCEIYESSIKARPAKDIKIVIPQAPQAFMTALAKCRPKTYNHSLVLKVREKILSFDSRLKEIKLQSNCFGYGTGKSNICADFKTKKSFGTQLDIELALRLPYSFGKKYRFSRLVLDQRFFFKAQHTHQWKAKSKLPTFNLRRKRLGVRSSGKWMNSSSFLREFIRAELDDYSDQIWETWDVQFIRYCQQQNLPNPSESYESMLMVLLEMSLRYWKEQL